MKSEVLWLSKVLDLDRPPQSLGLSPYCNTNTSQDTQHRRQKPKIHIESNTKHPRNSKEREKYSEKNAFLTPLLTSLHSEHQPICLLMTSSNISRNVSGPVVGTVESAQAQFWPNSSWYLLPESTIAPKNHSLRLIVEI